MQVKPLENHRLDSHRHWDRRALVARVRPGLSSPTVRQRTMTLDLMMALVMTLMTKPPRKARKNLGSRSESQNTLWKVDNVLLPVTWTQYCAFVKAGSHLRIAMSMAVGSNWKHT